MKTNKKLLGVILGLLLMVTVSTTGCVKEDLLGPGVEDPIVDPIPLVTNATPDTILPTVILTSPINLATNVYLNANITATFSEAMDPLTITAETFTLRKGTTNIPCAVTYVGTTATLNPTAALVGSTLYSVTLTTGVQDLASNAMALSNTWSFTTESSVDITAPVVNSTFPIHLKTNVALNANITATFSEAMRPVTITTTTFTLKEGLVEIPCVLTYVGNVATLNPNADLSGSTLYTAKITTDVQDLASNAMALEKSWTFTTGPSIALGPDRVNLGNAGTYIIVAKSAISIGATSALTGDLALSPAAASYITGLSLSVDAGNTFSTSSQVVGKIYAADYAPPTPGLLTTTISDMEAAYVDAAGRTTPDFLNEGAGAIGGLVLVPGLHKWTTGVLIPTDVTLSGGANDVWIFQIAGDLIIDSAVRVLLTGGAVSKNIFWQVSSSVVINTTAHVEGVVLAMTEIVVATGATVNGRLMSQSAIEVNQASLVEPAE